MSSEATIGVTEVRRGLIAGGGSLVRLARQVPWAQAMELALAGEPITAQHALSIGLVNRVVAPGEVLATAEDFARRISCGAPQALAKSKEAMVRSNGRPLEEAFAIETQCTKENASTADAKEGPRAFMEKREPVFTRDDRMTLLAGLRVVDMGLWVAGPAGGGILADWGADVVKIEMMSGDPMRKLFGALSGSKEERCPPFDLYNRGKRSIALDVNHPDGKALAARLVGTADVFVTNMRPQFLKRVELDHETMTARHPRLVYASLTGYGLEGPGFDVAAFSARSGVAHRATPPGAPSPILPGASATTSPRSPRWPGSSERSGHGRGPAADSLFRPHSCGPGSTASGMDVSTRLGLGRLAPAPSRSSPQNPLMNPYRAGDDRWFWLIGAKSERH